MDTTSSNTLNPRISLMEVAAQMDQMKELQENEKLLRKERLGSWASQPESRLDLKRQLYRERAITGRMVCPICKLELTTGGPGFDMHEVFLTRGDVMGCCDAVKQMIMTAQNCVLVHSEDCHQFAATHEGKLMCAKQIIVHEGFDAIKNWLSHMAQAMKGDQPVNEMRYLDAVACMLLGQNYIVPELSLSGL